MASNKAMAVTGATLRLCALTAIAVGFSITAPAQELSMEDHAAVFAAAGFKRVGDRYMRCDDMVTESGTTAFIEAGDLNGDGRPEAWIRESSTFCYGRTGEAFVLLTREASGAWVILLDRVGIGLPLETEHNGWPDIEIGSPGAGPFPIYRFDGTGYALVK